MTNPPFHRGHQTDFAAAERMIRRAPRHLIQSGRPLLVADSFTNRFPWPRGVFQHLRALSQNHPCRAGEARGPEASGGKRGP